MLKKIFNLLVEKLNRWIIDTRRNADRKRLKRRMNTELTEEMGVRRMEIYSAAKEFCEMLLDREPGIPTKEPLSIEILGPFIYESEKFFRKRGFEVCVPRVYQKNYIRKRCTLKRCKCRECKYSGKNK